jgi:dienelactone hydrolase
MDECAGGKVLVHCAANYRVTSFLAVYGEMKLGWTREKADAHARILWPLNETWTAFLQRCRDELLSKPAADRPA